MKNARFKNFKNYINEHGFDEYILHSGYLWISLTNKQLHEVAQIALTKGCPIDEKGNIHIDCWVIPNVIVEK